MPKPHPGRRADRWLPGVKPEGWLACEGGVACDSLPCQREEEVRI
ncbi:hypothetical protein LEMLEM_LOCUS8758, partial [Lemmus lemmus]